LSSVEGLWGDEITVRFDNGQIRHFATAADVKYSNETEEQAFNNPVAFLQSRVDEMYDHSRSGLTERIHVLNDVRNSAGRLITAGASHTDAASLHKIALEVEAEKREIKEALDHLEAADAEAFEAPATFSTSAVEQAELGRASADTWLDV